MRSPRLVQHSPAPTASPVAIPTATPEPTSSPTPESTPTATPEPTSTPTPEPTSTPTPESTPTATPEPTSTPTPEPTPTVIPTPGPDSAGVFELVDPNPSEPVEYKRSVTILSNNNVVVRKPDDTVNGLNRAGSVRIFDSSTQTIIASILGEEENDYMGSGGIRALDNGNFVILSPLDSVNGVTQAGSIKLIDGTTGAQIGSDIIGTEVGDSFGLGDVYLMPNNNFLVIAVNDNSAVGTDVGSIRLMSGETGEQLSTTYYGSTAQDFLRSEVVGLANGNFAVASPFTDNGAVEDTGAVHLFDALGEPVGETLYSGNARDELGSGSAVALDNNNLVLISPYDQTNTSPEAPGTVRLISGATNIEIGSPIREDARADLRGAEVLPLSNNNYILAMYNDNVSDLFSAGSVRLVSGTDNSVIGSPITGNTRLDRVGRRVMTLANNNYVLADEFVNQPGANQAGSVRLVSGTTGDIIGTPIVGTVENDRVGRYTSILSNGNIAIGSPDQDVNGDIDAGSVMLINGDTGVTIGEPLVGRAGSKLGDEGLRSLSNGNFLILSTDYPCVICSAPIGSVQLMDGLSNTLIDQGIRDSLVGEINDVSVFELSNGNYLLIGPKADSEGTDDIGAIFTLNSSTGQFIGNRLLGAVKNEFDNIEIHEASDGSFYVLNLLYSENHGLDEAGKMLLVRP